MLFVIICNNKTDKTTVLPFESYSHYIEKPLPNYFETIAVIDTNKPPRGNSYNEKHDHLDRMLLHYQYANKNLLYDDQIEIETYFIKHARRYGLLKALKSAGIDHNKRGC